MAFLFMPATIWPLESELCLLAHSPLPHPCLPSTHLKDFAVLISPSDKEHGCSFTWLHWINLKMLFLTTAIPLIMWTRLFIQQMLFFYVSACLCCFPLPLQLWKLTFSFEKKKKLWKLPVSPSDTSHRRIFHFFLFLSSTQHVHILSSCQALINW